MPPDDPANLSDELLLRAIARGDDSAFETLYHRHRDFALRLARRFAPGGDEHRAHDAVQDAFLYLVRKAGSITLRGKLTTLLYPVVKNCALAAARKDRRLKFTDAVPEAPTTPTLPPAPAVADERARSLAAALATLPDIQREVLLMRSVDGMSLEEIGTALSIPVGTVKSRLHHAVHALREHPACRGYWQDL